ncbi:MAG: NUDIX hydrolase [Spirochaetaceae bacterium]|nr:MAG: NUDIX hydrolase [Spirochaetaceae bacterium]
MSAGRKDDHLRWTEVDRRILVQTPIFRLVSSTRSSPEGNESDYYLITSPDWVNIVALTRDKDDRECFVMVRQFRHGNKQISIEFPGGVVDPGEDPARAVTRELLEETGYRAERILHLGSINPNPAIMDNRCHTYLAETVEHVADLSPDGDEFLEVELVPVRDLSAGKRGREFDHAMMHVALRFYEKYRENTGTKRGAGRIRTGE